MLIQLKNYKLNAKFETMILENYQVTICTLTLEERLHTKKPRT